MADCALNGQAHERSAHRCDPIQHVAGVALFRERRADVNDQVQTMEARGHQLVSRRLGIQIAGQLVTREVVVGQVVIEGSNHPVAIGRHLAIVIVVDAVGVGEAHQVQPIAGHVLAVVWTIEQSVHDFAIGIG